MQPSEVVLRGLLAAAPDALVAVADDGRIVFVNDQAERLFGWPRDELVGQPVEVLVPTRFASGHPRLRGGFMAEPSTRPMGAGLDLSARRRDGSEFPAEISLSSVAAPDGALVAAAIRDVTDRVELEAARQRAAVAAQQERSQRLESLGLLAGGVAHDFNNLLGVILNYTALLERQVTHPAAVADLGEIAAAAQRAAGLTRQLLTFARRDVVHPEPLDVNGVVRSVASMLERTLGEGVVLRLDLAPGPLVTVADQHQLEQIIVNLAINARDAMGSGGQLTIATDVPPAADAGLPPAIRLRVIDDGEGMPPEVMARAFEPFFSTKPAGAGTGLGLATVYGIVEQSGGTVALDSTVGVGSTVTVMLLGAEADPRALAGGAGPPATRRGTERVLLVEDQEPLRTATERILVDHGYEVVSARDGMDALAVFDEESGVVDLVLTDVAMPRMRGDELVRQLTERRPGLRALFMSGYDSGTISLPGRLLSKPVPVDVLLDAVREVLDA